MIRALLIWLAIFGLGFLGSCSVLQQPNASQSLVAFCRLHRTDIFRTLLTERQRRAGDIACAAVGEALGT